MVPIAVSITELRLMIFSVIYDEWNSESTISPIIDD
jgi:hypothetical protein